MAYSVRFIRLSGYYQHLIELVTAQVNKLDNDQIDALWKQSDIADDYASSHLGPPDYESYSGNKISDIIAQIIDLIYVDVICCTVSKHRKTHT